MTARDPVSSGEAMIEANGLAKYYGDFIAIEDVSFRVPRGEIVAFLGPNGAGKSTTMKILTGYLAPTAGTARQPARILRRRPWPDGRPQEVAGRGGRQAVRTGKRDR